MLVLTRKKEETIRIGADITIRILRVRGRTVQVGIEAPRGVEIVRGELVGPSPSKPTQSTATKPPILRTRTA